VSGALGDHLSQDTRKAVKLMVRDGVANSTGRSLHRWGSTRSTQWDLCGSSAVVGERPSTSAEQTKRQQLTEVLGRADSSSDTRRKSHGHTPLAEGWQGGGGVYLIPPMVGEACMLEKMEVINVAMLRWKRKMKRRTGPSSS